MSSDHAGRPSSQRRRAPMSTDRERQDTDDLRHRFDAIVAASTYMTTPTAGAGGSPWASPVWFASVDGREFLWISKPGARHSRNIAARPDVAIAIFDSSQPPGT